MKITQKYLPANTLRRPSLPILGVKFIVAHDTGNLNSTALQNVDYYIKSANEVEASAHTFIDDINIIECIPQSEKAYHVRRVVDTDNQIYGFDAIDYALGIELCFFDDVPRSKLAYNNYVEYIKGLCIKYGLNSANSLVGHYKLDPTRRTDPINAFSKIGKTWENFLKDVSITPTTPTPTSTKEILQKYIGEVKIKVGLLETLINEL